MNIVRFPEEKIFLAAALRARARNDERRSEQSKQQPRSARATASRPPSAKTIDAYRSPHHRPHGHRPSPHRLRAAYQLAVVAKISAGTGSHDDAFFVVGFSFVVFCCMATRQRRMRGYDFRCGRNASRLKPPATFAILASSRARYPSGKGEVCKTFIRGFDSHPRLQRFLISARREKRRSILSARAF